MQTFESAGNAAVRSPKKLASAILVGWLHLGAIYTLLVALDVVPNPVAPPPPIITARVLDQTKTTPPPSSPQGSVVLRHPTSLPGPRQPKIDIQNVQNGNAPINPSVTDGTAGPIQPNSGITLPVRAVAATHTIPRYPAMGIRLGYEGT